MTRLKKTFYQVAVRILLSSALLIFY